MKRKYNIGIIPGDGIGRDVMRGAVMVLDTINELTDEFNLDFLKMDIGEMAVKKFNTPFPEETRKGIAGMDTVLFGAVGSPYDFTVLTEIRSGFNLYANVRPIQALPDINAIQPKADIILVRENTEGLYTGVGYIDRNHHVNLRIFTTKGMERILRFCFNLAAAKGRRKVTFTHKASVLKYTDAPMKKMFYEIAAEYPDIESEDAEIDACAMRIIMKPETLDVVFAENANGDILSDVGGGIIGGMGFTPSGNIGDSMAVFEPVHGSAPKHADKNIVNPTATIMAAKMMFDYLNEAHTALRIEEALKAVLVEGKVRTYDIGGRSSTSEFAAAVCDKMRRNWTRSTFESSH
jgi:isocitrate/isopropylmalate dehydrogenase